MLFKKIICFLFGHQQVDGLIPGIPLVQFATAPINGCRFSWSIMGCNRCVSYQESRKYTEKEWQKLMADSMEKAIREIEKVAQEYEHKISDEIESVDGLIVNKTNKLVH
jgi:hypothetical protein